MDVEGHLAVTYGNAALAICVELAKHIVVLENELQKIKENELNNIYDVIVIGFGGAGAGAARFAADNNAKVLLIDAAPEGSEGGNTRYAGGAFAWGSNFDQLKEYYKQTYYPFEYDEEALDTFIKNVMQMKQQCTSRKG